MVYKPQPIYELEQLLNPIIEQSIESGALHTQKLKDSVKEKNKQLSRYAAKQFGRRYGLKPVEDIERDLMHVLTDRIKQEVRRKKLTHLKLAGIVLASRPKITRILNYNFRGVSLAFLLRILSALGIPARIAFD